MRIPGAGRRSQRGSGALLTAISLATLGGAPIWAANEHVRVVLDISRSMGTNDPRRLATLSTLLLYDLADPDLTLGDSFVVIPFHPGLDWNRREDPPPTEVGRRIVPRPEDRAGFVTAVTALDYDGGSTHFYPGIRAALEDLEKTPGGLRDVRVIVVVTDGAPTERMREVEAGHIRRDLLPRLAAAGIRLYVLAFGAEAAAHRSHFDEIVQGGSSRLGEVFVDPQGDRLLFHMAEIFSRSFGYSQDPPRLLPGVRALDLRGGSPQSRVVVGVFSPSGRAPSFELTEPPGGDVNAPGGEVHAAEQGASYSLTWVLSPDPGAYGFDTDTLAGSVVVLRPIQVRLEVQPVPPTTQATRAMAETPLPLRVLIRPPAGAQGDVPPVDLTFRSRGDRTGSGYAFLGKEGAPSGGTTLTPEGREAMIEVTFPERPPTGRDFYRGFLEVTARHGEAVVGELAGPTAHPIEVYPRLQMRPVPAQGDARSESGGPAALGRRQRGCAHFQLDLDLGELPHRDRSEYAIRAVLDPSVHLSGALHEATVLLDGLPVEAPSSPPPQAPAWSKGRTLSRDQLLGEHQVCVQVGRPRSGATDQPISIPLRFSLLESPYDELPVIAPFTLEALIAPPGLVEHWNSAVLLALAFVAGALGLWHARPRARIPADLQVAVARVGAPMSPASLGERSPLSRLFGLGDTRAVAVPEEGRVLGHLVADLERLYSFRPARGFRVEVTSPTLPSGAEADGVQVHRLYRISSRDGDYFLRLQFR